MPNNEAHVRIDEGIKRGPKIPRRSVPRRKDEETGRVEGIPANLDPHSVLALYSASRTTSHIAKELGLKRKTLVAWLREKVPQEWKQVQITRALMRKEDADEGLETARDALSLARPREMLKSAQWDLERLDSSNYGIKQELTVTHTIPSDVLKEIGQLRQELGVRADTVSNTPNAALLSPVSNTPLTIEHEQDPDT